VRLRWSCHVQLCAGHAACGVATAVPRAQCCDGRAMCGAAIVVPCVFVRRSCHIRAATVVPRAFLRRSYGALCVRWQRGGVTPTAVGPCSGAAAWRVRLRDACGGGAVARAPRRDASTSPHWILLFQEWYASTCPPAVADASPSMVSTRCEGWSVRQCPFGRLSNLNESCCFSREWYAAGCLPCHRCLPFHGINAL